MRRLFTIALALAAGALAIGWLYNIQTGNQIQAYREYSDEGSWMFRVDGGQMRVSHWLFTKGTSNTTSTKREKLGFGFYLHQASTPLGETLLIHRIWCPVWWAMFVLGALPLLELSLWIQRKCMRKPRHCCPECDYSLIGLSSPRCPECGLEVELPEQVSESDYVDPARYRRIRRWVTAVVLGLLLGGSTIIAMLVAGPGAPQNPAPLQARPFFVIPQGNSGATYLPIQAGRGNSGLVRVELNQAATEPVKSEDSPETGMSPPWIDGQPPVPVISGNDRDSNGNGSD